MKKAKEYTLAQLKENEKEKLASDNNNIYNKFPIYTKTTSHLRLVVFFCLNQLYYIFNIAFKVFTNVDQNG